MSRLLAEARPVVVCEMHGRNREFCAAISSAGYAVVDLDGPSRSRRLGVNVHALCVPRDRVAA